MKRLLLLFLYLIIQEVNAQCTFEQIFPFYPSQYHRFLIAQNSDYMIANSAFNDTLRSVVSGKQSINFLRLDTCGNPKWHKLYGLAEGNAAYGIAETDVQDFIMIGKYADESGMRVLKIDKDGNLIFEKRLLNIPLGTAVYLREDCLTKLGNNTFLITGNKSPNQGLPSVSFILQIDENGNTLRYKEYPQTFKRNKAHYSCFTQILNDTSFYSVLTAGYETYDTTYKSSGEISVSKRYYTDIVVAFLDTGLNITDWYSVTDLVADSVRPHIGNISGIYVKPVNDTVIFINGQNIFKDLFNVGNKDVSTLLSVKERKIISRTKEDLNPLCFRKDMVSLYRNYNDSGFIFRDKDLNIIKTIKTSSPQKDNFSYSATYLTDDMSIVAMGTSTYRKIKVSPKDSAFIRSEYALEMYIIKIDSNGYFTPTTWNGVQDVQKGKENSVVFPNPNNGKFTIQLENSKSAEVSVYDMQGKLVLTKTIEAKDADINIENKGLYLVRIKTERGESAVKVLVE